MSVQEDRQPSAHRFYLPVVSIAIMDSEISLPTCTDEVIEALVHASCGDTASAHEKYVYRESLRNLVRLAKAEQRNGVDLASGFSLLMAGVLH